MRVTGALHDGPTQLHYSDENVDVISLHSNRIRSTRSSVFGSTTTSTVPVVLETRDSRYVLGPRLSLLAPRSSY